MDKESFVENIKKWVAIDTQIKSANEKIKHARTVKHDLLENITKYVSNANMDHTKINISDGTLQFFDKKEYQPITFTYIESCLSHLINDKTQVEQIMKYVKDHREIKVTKEIRRTYTNKNEL